MQRKTVTVLFCDVTGSTALGESVDSEALRALLARYFERMKAIIERHGGSVEKFIGDAVMAVFGVPVAHEDDALRAVRAAKEMREALPELGVQARIGVTTGEVVTGTEERLATGDAVNVAARLEQAAEPGEVLIGEPTLALVVAAVDVEPMEPLELKGKAEPVATYRLLRVLPAPERAHEAQFVGREQELGILREAWERAQAEGRCELVTVLGDAGVGKSRLVAEALGSLGAALARGRCLPYGEGITYWPIVEVLKQLDVRPPEESAAAAIRSLLRETDVGTSAEEIAWAFRKTLEHAAAERPLAVVFDDTQWGEDTFLDLIEHVALLSSGSPILLLCVARPELLERRSAWPVALRLEPLGEKAVEELIPERIAGDLRERIARAAGGNPLFIGEMVAMAGERDGDVVVPPTLQALLTARLDQLEAGERGVLERGAVEGEIFHRGAVQALAPEEPQVTPRLAALVRKQLIRPDRPQLPGEDGFRFRHLLIRDAAYDALPKAVRAELHGRFAAWLDEHGSGLVELDEILGYHLEQACRYRAELGLEVPDEQAAGARARLAAAGRQARLLGDERAAVSLFERASAFLPPGEFDVALQADLIDALFWSGRGEDALRRGAALTEQASASGDRVAELVGRLKVATLRINIDPEGATERLAVLAEEAVPVFEHSGDDLALSIAYFGLAWVADMRGNMAAGLEAHERSAEHARRAGFPHEQIGWRASVRLLGPTPLSEVVAWLDAQNEEWRSSHSVRSTRGHALAMLGHFEEARRMLGDVRAELSDRGGGIQLGLAIGQSSVDVELLAGDPAAAVGLGEEGCRMLDELGEHSLLSTAAGMLAEAYYALGRLPDAESWAGRAAELGASDDVTTQMLWRQVRAKVLARSGQHDEGERLAREAVALGEKTDLVNHQGNAYADLAEVFSLAGWRDGAEEALAHALELYERKENLVMAERMRARLAELESISAH